MDPCPRSHGLWALILSITLNQCHQNQTGWLKPVEQGASKSTSWFNRTSVGSTAVCSKSARTGSNSVGSSGSSFISDSVNRLNPGPKVSTNLGFIILFLIHETIFSLAISVQLGMLQEFPIKLEFHDFLLFCYPNSQQ